MKCAPLSVNVRAMAGMIASSVWLAKDNGAACFDWRRCRRQGFMLARIVSRYQLPVRPDCQ
jgi:hypothetical protein